MVVGTDPFVMVPWDHNGGYYYGDDHIRAFSHTHLVGAGTSAGGVWCAGFAFHGTTPILA